MSKPMIKCDFCDYTKRPDTVRKHIAKVHKDLKKKVKRGPVADPKKA